ncbi:MAG: glycoside hydrolase family 16 protein [Fibrobacterales bacterium]
MIKRTLFLASWSLILITCAPNNDLTLGAVSDDIADIGSEWELIWTDDFEDPSLDTDKWKIKTGNGEWGWGNGELQNYREENLSFRDGALVITAKKERIGMCHNGSCNYTSAKIETSDKFSFKYGKIEARMKLPPGQAMWPAFWLIGDNISSWRWPKCGEIDIMEFKGRLPTVTQGTIHWGDDSDHKISIGHDANANIDLTEDFHVYGLIWEESKFTFTLDGTSFGTVAISGSNTTDVMNPFGSDSRNDDQEFFIILNLAVGGIFDEWIEPEQSFSTSEFLIDWVRVSQLK